MRSLRFFNLLGWMVLAGCLTILIGGGEGFAGGWPDIKVRLLPDESFAVTEVVAGGKARHCPHHDQNGKIDENQLIYVLGTLDLEAWQNLRKRDAAEKHLKKHYDRLHAMIMIKGVQGTININRADLIELVALPRVGPVLAVKIVDYRNARQMYLTKEDLKKVDGIGPGTFNAIRHYISVD